MPIMAYRTPVAVCALVTVLALAGCSAPAEPAAPGTSGAATPSAAPAGGGITLPEQTVGSEVDCSLYSFDDLSALWGVPMVDMDLGTVIEAGGAGGIRYSCDYNETDSGLGLTVVLEYREFDTEDGAIQDLANVRSGAVIDGVTYTQLDDVADLGDEAFFATKADLVGDPSNPSELLYVRSGSLVVLLTATNLDGVQPEYRDNLIATWRLHLEA